MFTYKVLVILLVGGSTTRRGIPVSIEVSQLRRSRCHLCRRHRPSQIRNRPAQCRGRAAAAAAATGDRSGRQLPLLAPLVQPFQAALLGVDSVDPTVAAVHQGILSPRSTTAGLGLVRRRRVLTISVRIVGGIGSVVTEAVHQFRLFVDVEIEEVLQADQTVVQIGIAAGRVELPAFVQQDFQAMDLERRKRMILVVGGNE